MIKYTRKQYMAGDVDHDEYYSQFGQHLINLVSSRIGAKRIQNSKDSHFSDIPLEEWDALQSSVMAIVRREIAEANGTGGVSLSDCVCAAKSAAKHIKDTQ